MAIERNFDILRCIHLESLEMAVVGGVNPIATRCTAGLQDLTPEAGCAGLTRPYEQSKRRSDSDTATYESRQVRK